MTYNQQENDNMSVAEVFRNVMESQLEEDVKMNFDNAMDAAIDLLDGNTENKKATLRDNLWLLLVHMMHRNRSKELDTEEEEEPMLAQMDLLDTIVPTAVVGNVDFLADLSDLFISFYEYFEDNNLEEDVIENVALTEDDSSEEDSLVDFYQLMRSTREMMLIKSGYFDLFFPPKRFFYYLRETNPNPVDRLSVIVSLLEYQVNSAYYDFDFTGGVTYFGLDYNQRRDLDRATDLVSDFVERFETSSEYGVLTSEQKMHADFIVRMTLAYSEGFTSLGDASVVEILDIDSLDLEDALLHLAFGDIYAPKEVFDAFGDVLIAVYRFLQSEGEITDISEQINWLEKVKDDMYEVSEDQAFWSDEKMFYKYLVEKEIDTNFSEGEWMTANFIILSFCMEEGIDIGEFGREYNDAFDSLAERNLDILKDEFFLSTPYQSMPKKRQPYVNDVLTAYSHHGYWLFGPDYTRWTAEEVYELLYDIFPGHAVLSADSFHEVVPVMTAFYQFLELEDYVVDSSVRKALEKLDRKAMDKAAADSESWSIHKTMGMIALEQGIDPSDPEMEQIYDMFNSLMDEELDQQNEPGKYEDRRAISDTPAIADPLTKIGRNERVTVEYEDGRKVENVKFKKVANDVESGKCRLVETGVSN